MNKNTYLELRSELANRGYFKPVPLIGIATLSVETIIFVLLCYGLVQAEKYSIFFWLLETLIGLSMFRFFALMHECGHQSMFTRRIHNSLGGYYASIFCFIPYEPWRELHLQHHKWVGVIDMDPTQAGLLKLKSASSTKIALFKVIWKLCIPIPSIQLVFSVFWMRPFQLIKKGKITESLIALCSPAICLAPHVLVIGCTSLETYVSYVLPMIILFFVWFETINFTHHSGLFPFTSETHPAPIPLHEQDQVSRTSAFPVLLSTIFSYNFNFHTEHHYFPRMPWHHLPKVYRIIRDRGLRDYYHDVPFLGFSFYLRKKDPVAIYIDSLPQPKSESI